MKCILNGFIRTHDEIDWAALSGAFVDWQACWQLEWPSLGKLYTHTHKSNEHEHEHATGFIFQTTHNINAYKYWKNVEFSIPSVNDAPENWNAER